MNKENDLQHLRAAIALARQGMNSNAGGPFGCVIVDARGQLIGKGNNRVTSTNDPTAHAEVVAIREACQTLGNFQLEGCTLYASCEPCPMCLGAIYWARPARIVFACTREDAAAIGFDDDFIYQEIGKGWGERSIPTEQQLREEGLAVFEGWGEKGDKVGY